ncbi:MAG TPA: sigma 54-interacting transcriptional regulator [Planctomycetota bacterium]|nr:sigma 54-interacting transcriptional regulator [Planctomycetota bacterium]
MSLSYRGARYHILETLGEGGTGTVFRARDLLDGRLVALKVLASGGDGTLPLLVSAEFRLLASQSHPHIVRVLDYGVTADGLPFFTMELLEGRDLLTFARDEGSRGRPGESRAEALGASVLFAEVVRQILDALEYIHRRGVLHLDLKPSNVLVGMAQDGRPIAKLIDFNLARGPGSAPADLSGTAEYLAPERIQGEAPGVRSDIYAFGVTLSEALLGAPPFEAASAGEVLRLHLGGSPALEGLPVRYRSTVARCLEKQPSRRPASAHAVLVELFGEETGPEGSLPFFGAAFVGREDLLLRLEGAVGLALQGTPRSVLIRGGTGAGKTRLLRELSVRLQTSGIASGVETPAPGAARPGDLALRLLRRAELGHPASLVDVLPGFEALGAFADESAGREAIDLEGGREKLVHRFVRRFLDLAAIRTAGDVGGKPLVLLADDVHAADSLSRAVLLSLLSSVEHRGGARLCVILAARDENEADLQAVAEIERAARGFQSFESIALRNLSPEDVGRYLSRVLGEGEATRELARTLALETGGNIFFIEEHLKLLVRSGRARRRGARWEVEAGAMDVPRTVEEAITRRLSRLDRRATDVLEWAAVLDAPFTPEEMADHVGGGPGTGPREVDLISGALVLEETLAREGARYSFAHAAARAVVYGSMDDASRRRRHGAAAERLLRAGERGEGERLEEIAHHLYSSDDPARARVYLMRAGERARRAGALREALEHFSRALEVTRDDRERFDILLGREEVLGHLGRKEAERRDITDLAALAAVLGEPWRRKEALLREALFLESAGNKKEALALLERDGALGRDAGSSTSAEDPRDASLDLRILSRTGMLRFYLSDFEGGFEAVGRALALARGKGDRSLEAECRQIAGLGHYLRSNHDLALEEMGLALAIRRESGEEHRVGALESNLGLIHLERGDLEAAEERFLASLKVFRRLGLRRGEAVNLLNLGLVLLEMGRLERALDSIHESLRIRRELGDRRGEGADMGNLAWAWIQLGRSERAVPLLEDALRIARELENRQSESANESRLGHVELERGGLEKALERLERGLRIAAELRLPAQEILARTGIARVRMARDEWPEAREEAESALRLALEARMHRRVSSARSLLAMALLGEGRLEDAGNASRQAVEELEEQLGWTADAHVVWFQRHLVLEAQRREAGAVAEADCEEALRRAYQLLREKSDAMADDELRQGYLENIPIHRELNRLHEALQARNRREASRRERSFHDIARSIHSIVEIDPLLDRLLDLVIETTHAEKGLIVLRGPGGEFTTRAARRMAMESVADATDICKSVIADVAGGAEPVLAVDAGTDDRFRGRQSIKSFRIRTLMCVPLVVRDEIIGAVYVDGRGASSFDRDDLAYLVSFSQLAAIALENARLLERLRAENVSLRREVEARPRFEALIGRSAAMERLTRMMEKVANTPASILICGETGTGKEVVARSIHRASGRKARAFVCVDCGALPENLLESELFGHRRGAFSGAIHDRVGLFEEAQGGTLFLDEITNTSLDLQAKLLRVLQEGEVRRVGENQVKKVDVRIIAASNIDVRAAVESGAFREDLYYRLNVIPIEVPPLRERREDIPFLALHFLEKSRVRHAKAITGFTEAGLGLLASASWRGNVRELENFIEKAVILAEDSRIDAPFLEGLLAPSARPPAPDPGLPAVGAVLVGVSLAAGISLEDFDRRWLEAERAYLQGIVTDAKGNLAEAARRAQVRNRNTLISRLKRHGIHGKGKEQT